jgi:branched-chain amino acid transport system permease protein
MAGRLDQLELGPPGAPTRRARLPRQPMLRHLALAAPAGAALFLLSDNLSQFRDSELGLIGAYVIALAGLHVLTGLNGQLSLGHGALMAVGGYTTALALKHTGMGFAEAAAASTGAATAAGALIGLAAARLRGPYLAGATLALAVALPDVATKYASVFGGDQGLPVPPLSPPASLGPNFTPDRWLAWISLLLALATLVVLANLKASRFGRNFQAVRDDEVAAQLAGIHVARTQVLAFVVSAACAGLAGCLYAYASLGVFPESFSLSLSISLLTGAVIGGLGSLLGAVWGAVVLVYLQELATDVSRDLALSQTVSSRLALAVYGLALIGAILAFPSGIQGGMSRLAGRVRRALGPPAPAPPAPRAQGAPQL